MPSHASHLGIDLREYDARIRTFIPDYEEMLEAAAAAIDTLVPARRPRILDLGTGSGALASRVLRVRPQADVVGMDNDPDMLAVGARRLRGRLTPVVADFGRAALNRHGDRRFDAVTASFALHHIRTKRQKAAVYERCRAALGRRGVLVNADCCLAASGPLQRGGRVSWRSHLERTYTRAESERFLQAWAREDVYFTLDDELEMMRRAGFAVDVVWRRHAFAVVAGKKPR